MVNVTAELESVFRNAGITLIDEDVQDSVNTYPLVTYAEAENTDAEVGDNVGYSRIAYTINVWARSKAEVIAMSQRVDKVMKSVFFMREGGLEQDEGGLYHNIYTYRRLVRESY